MWSWSVVIQPPPVFYEYEVDIYFSLQIGTAQPNGQSRLCWRQQQKLSLIYPSVDTPEGNVPAGQNDYAHC